MTVIEIVEAALQASGHDGLFSDLDDCSCLIGDLAPCCDNYVGQCEAGYKVSCTCHEGGWHVQREKP